MEPNKNKFKLVLTGIFGFFIILGLVAFSTYRSNSIANNETPIAVWGTLDKDTFDNFVAKYKQDKTIDFKLTYIQKDISVIDGDLVEAIATGKAPDAILIPQELMKRYLDKVSLITSIPERTFKDTYVQEAEMYIQPDGMFALPFFVDPLVMYWNRDIFTTAGIATPPKLWSEFPLLAGKLFQSDDSGTVTQTLASLGEYSNVTNAKALISALILQAGSPIVNTDDAGALKSALYDRVEGVPVMPAVSALSFFTDYANPKKSVYSWNRALPASQKFFLSGNLATYFGFASEAASLHAKNPNLNFDIAEMPQTVGAKVRTTFGELYGFAFLKSSPNLVPAFNLLSTLASPDGVNELMQFADVAPARRDMLAAGTTDPEKAVFFSSALIAKGWLDVSAKDTSQIFQEMVENITTGRMTADDAVQKASTELDILLQS